MLVDLKTDSGHWVRLQSDTQASTKSWAGFNQLWKQPKASIWHLHFVKPLRGGGLLWLQGTAILLHLHPSTAVLPSMCACQRIG